MVSIQSSSMIALPELSALCFYENRLKGYEENTAEHSILRCSVCFAIGMRKKWGEDTNWSIFTVSLIK